jgi:hypothetical protein
MICAGRPVQVRTIFSLIESLAAGGPGSGPAAAKSYAERKHLGLVFVMQGSRRPSLVKGLTGRTHTLGELCARWLRGVLGAQSLSSRDV